MTIIQKNKKKLIVESTQQNIPFIDIHAGLLVTKDRRFIKILEVRPIPFTLRSFEEQDAIIARFARVLKIAPNNLQLTVLTLPADIYKTLEKLDSDMKIETSENCKKMAKEYREELEYSKRSSVTRRFFLSFQFEDPSSVFHNVTIKEVVRWMDDMTARIKSALESCGNIVIDPDIKDENYFSGEILYTLLNRHRSGSTPFHRRIEDVYERYKEKKEEPYVPLTDYIAPGTIRFFDRKYNEIDGTYYRYLYIRNDGYSQEVFSGWLSLFINSYPGVDMDIYLERVPKEYVINDVRKNLVYNKVDHAENTDTSEAFEHSDAAMGAGYYLKDGLAAGEDFYRAAVLITISGTSMESVDRIADELKKSAASKDIRLSDINYNTEDAYLASLPIVKMPDSIWKKANRNMLTSGAASFYPFLSFELNDPDGIYFGKDQSTNAMAIVDIFDSKKYTNANMFVCGTTGSGKTFSTLLISARTRIKHIPCFLITPEKEHEYRRICNAMGGQFIQFGAGSPDRINIMEIYHKNEDTDRMIDGDYSPISYLSEKAQNLRTFFGLLFTGGERLGIEEARLFDKAVYKTYERFGITEDNASLYDPERPGRYKKMPILGDLEKTLREKEGKTAYEHRITTRLANILSILTTGSGASFNGETNVDLSNDFTVLGLEHLTKDMVPLGMFMAMDFAWSRIKEDRTKRKMLLIDECWSLANNEIAADYMFRIAKTIRAYGGSLILATQQLSDIYKAQNGAIGDGLLNNCKIKVILQLEKDDAEKVQDALKLTDAEKERVIGAKKGDALLIAGENHIGIHFEATDTEYDLLTTDRMDQERLVKKAKEGGKKNDRGTKGI